MHKNDVNWLQFKREISLAFICMVCTGCFYCYPVCKGEKSFIFTKLKLFPTHTGFKTGRSNCWLCRPLLTQSAIYVPGWIFNLTDSCLDTNISRWYYSLCGSSGISWSNCTAVAQNHPSISVTPEMLGELQQKAFRCYLYNPIPSFQCSIFASWAVFQDMLDKDPSHHFSITQAASHPSSSNNADPQWLARLSPEFDPFVKKKGRK